MSSAPSVLTAMKNVSLLSLRSLRARTSTLLVSPETFDQEDLFGHEKETGNPLYKFLIVARGIWFSLPCPSIIVEKNYGIDPLTPCIVDR